jgi:hypothetical protein
LRPDSVGRVFLAENIPELGADLEFPNDREHVEEDTLLMDLGLEEGYRAARVGDCRIRETIEVNDQA